MSIYINHLTISNFGPYLGRHDLKIGYRPGIWVVYGENGRGKTSILNAFRYVLYGEVLGRLGPKRPQEFVNRRHAEDGGQRSFELQLQFCEGDDEFQVSRSCDLGGNETLIVHRNGAALAPEMGKRELERLFPPPLADFFLFDGEKLQRYEQLSISGSEQSASVRAEVERLLGVTALEEGREHLEKLQGKFHRELQRALTRADTGDDRNHLLAQLLDRANRLTTDRDNLRARLAEKDAELRQIAQALDDQEEAQRHLREIDSHQQELAVVRDELSELTSRLSELAPDIWKSIVGLRAREMLEKIRNRAAQAREEHAINLVERALEVLRSRDAEGMDCPVCGESKWPRDLIGRIASEAFALEEATSASSPSRTEAIEDALDQVLASSRSGEIRIVRDLMDRARLREYAIQRNLQTANTQLLGINREEVRRLVSGRDSAMAIRTRIVEQLKECEAEIEGVHASINRLQDQIAQADSARSEINTKIALLRDLIALFQEAREAYKAQTLTEVESRASELFQRMRTESEYSGLRINDNYGLFIVDSNNNIVPNPSAGYEHLVALALIGALQGIAPVQSPVIIDSPFHRLDQVHTRHSVAALPHLAEQVILLTFGEDFNRGQAVTDLGSMLMDEYKIERANALESRIVQGIA